ncbi:MAG TPA: aminoglycoside phosphotransferase family protein [Planctomycetota bacterium]|jgi:Ser/Thr protein kinase RdoA (MazF antagonist)|nr:aminoglycoside phosphotransferase family protein [Planctomycetota bacterium]
MRRPPAGSDVARRDPSIPGLAALLDPEGARRAVGEALRREIPSAPVVEYVRYKPGVSALLLWRAEVPGGGPARVYAKAYADDRAQADAAKAAARLGEGDMDLFTVLGATRAVAFAFPYDAGLPGLRRLHREDGLKRALARARPERSEAGWRPKARGTALEIVRYKPENRCVFRLDARWRRDADGSDEREPLFGRALPPERARRSNGVLAAFAPLAGVRIPRLAGFDEATGTVLVTALPGRALLEFGGEPDAFAAVGRALAALHRSGLPLPPAESGGERIERLRRECASLGRAGEPWAGTALRLLDRIGPSLGEQSAVVHGDFHAEQVLLEGGEVGFVDLDGAGAGDPFLDVGSFLGHLRLLVRSGDLTEDQAGGGAEAFLEGYGVAVEGLEAATTLALLDLGLSSVSRLEARASERVAGVVDEARALLDPPPLVRAAIRKNGTCEYEYVRRTPAGPRRRWEVVPPDREREVFEDPASAGPIGLRVALEPAALSVFLPERRPRGPRIAVERTEILSLRPGRRSVVRAHLADGSTLVVRVYPPGHVPQGLPPSPEGGTPRLARRLGEVSDLGLVFFEDLRGDSLSDRLRGPSAEADLRETARALREFHGGPLPGKRRDLQGELGIAARRQEAVSRVGGPATGERAEVIEQLRALAAGLPEGSPGRLHGDFHEKQVLVGPDGIAFLDLDDAAGGDPALDVGNFLAHLELREAQGTVLPGGAEPWRAAFLEAYGTAGEALEERIALFRGVSLVRLSALHAIRPDSASVVLDLLRRSREALDCVRG